MTTTQTRISTANFIGIKPPYLTEILQPALLKAMQKPRTAHDALVAGKYIRIHSYGESLRSIHRAMEHLPSPTGTEPDLTIHIWNEDTDRGIDMPWSDPRFFFSPETHAERAADSFVGVCLQGDHIIEVFDGEKNAYVRLPGTGQVPGWVAAAPARAVLHWFLSTQGINLVHGAALSINGRAALISARGGSGKSTTALACAAEGHGYLGDDYIAIQHSNPLTLHSVYHSVKVAAPMARALTNTALLDEHGTVHDKAVLFLRDIFPDSVQHTATLDAILIPRIVEGPATTITPARKAEALIALAPTTLMQLPFSPTDTPAQLSTIIERTPCFNLLLGSDKAAVAPTIAQFLSTL